MHYQTIHGNNYFLNNRINQIFYLHPVLHYVSKNINKKKFEYSDKNEIYIKGYGNIRGEDIDFYTKKYKFLIENQLLSTGIKEINYHRYTGQDIRVGIANSNRIVFEATEKCNLRCTYCAFGELYEGYDSRQNKDFNFKNARVLLDYLAELWNSNLNTSIGRTIYIGFYGGEPLLNFSFIKEIVKYAQNLKLKHHNIGFMMTTNAILLDKYMDFLVENDFILTISVDGDEYHNQYRVFKNGNPTYSKVKRNMLKLRDKYPTFYSLNVNTNSVFHHKSSFAEIHKHLQHTFSKHASRISELSRKSISEDGEEKINELYGNLNGVYKNELSCDPNILNYHDFFKDNLRDLAKAYNRYAYDSFTSLLYDKNQKRLPTGTCVPFQHKIYATVNGKILPCEKINYNFSIGEFNDESVDIDFEAIAKRYNRIFDDYATLCSRCYYNNICGHCVLFVDDPLKNSAECTKFKNQKQFKKHISDTTTYLEQKPNSYHEIINQLPTK